MSKKNLHAVAKYIKYFGLKYTNAETIELKPNVIIIEFFLPNFLFSINEAAKRTGRISNNVDNNTFNMSLED